MIAGCYSLHLYCDNSQANDFKMGDGVHSFGEFPHEYSDELGSRCRQMARQDGWKLTKDGKAYCRRCTLRPVVSPPTAQKERGK